MRINIDPNQPNRSIDFYCDRNRSYFDSDRHTGRLTPNSMEEAVKKNEIGFGGAFEIVENPPFAY